ncbi:hypothetical protein IW261DRAFT_1471939 [Armillaria novae-zelandiae]|uniref:Uncharacterized protein n=1 Tax=Armillaria novae-zelandiae TaxID=153914 RepID=A0AA39UGM7_9AGAR|nr:hypothetical protein IW261DRAFT_1471939 [Armillaria novae-zelandiae]
MPMLIRMSCFCPLSTWGRGLPVVEHLASSFCRRLCKLSIIRAQAGKVSATIGRLRYDIRTFTSMSRRAGTLYKANDTEKDP